MTIYTKLKELFEKNPIGFEGVTLDLIDQGLMYLAPEPLHLMSLKLGEIVPCEFVVQQILLDEKSPIHQEASFIYAYFVHLDRLIEAYQPTRHNEQDNIHMKSIIQGIINIRLDWQKATGFVHHDEEILLGRLAAIGDPSALEWYESSILTGEEPNEIAVNTTIGAYEGEKSKWNGTVPNKSIQHFKKSFFAIADLPTFSENAIVYGIYLNCIMHEIVPHLKSIPFDHVKDMFDKLESLYRQYQLFETLEDGEYFFEMASRYSKQQSDTEWLLSALGGLELQLSPDFDDETVLKMLDRSYRYAIELARLDKVGEDKALKILTSIFERSGVVENEKK